MPLVATGPGYLPGVCHILGPDSPQFDEILEKLLTNQYLGAIVRNKSNMERRFKCRRIA